MKRRAGVFVRPITRLSGQSGTSLLIAAIIAPWLAQPALGAEIVVKDTRTALLSGQQVKLGFTVRSDQAFEGRLAWSHTAQGRTIAQGERALKADAGTPAEIGLTLSAPEVREAVVYETELTVRLLGTGNQTAATHQRPLHLFARDPFADRQQWLRKSGIRVYDPEGETIKVLEAAGVPATRLRSLPAERPDDAGLLVIAEGLDLTKHRGLMETAVRLAAAGLPVLCLAPAEGSFDFPGADDAQPMPERVLLAGPEIIHQFDKRLDTRDWTSDDQPLATRLAITVSRGRPLLSVGEPPRGWPWAEAAFPGNGSVIVCGFRIVRHWDTGPTPRYLLLKVFERLLPSP